MVRLNNVLVTLMVFATILVIRFAEAQLTDEQAKMPFICCVPGCGEDGKRSLHSFPKNQNQCRKWIQKTWTFFLNKENAWRTHYKVCWKHFQQIDFRNWNLLNKGVVPSMMLPHSITMEHDYCTRNSVVMHADSVRFGSNTDAVNSLPSVGSGFNSDTVNSLPSVGFSSNADAVNSSHSVGFGSNVDAIKISADDQTLDISTVTAVNVQEELMEEEHVSESSTNQQKPQLSTAIGISADDRTFFISTGAAANVHDESMEEHVSESSTNQQKPQLSTAIGISADDRTIFISTGAAANVQDESMEEHVSESSTDQQKPQVSETNPVTSSQETFKPKTSKTYDPISRKMRYLSNRNKALSKQLKLMESANLKSNKKSKVKKKIDAVLKTLSVELPPEHYNFIKLQIKNTGKKSKNGNRFTLEERTLALLIYKQNPRRYNDLRKMANLPTRQTLIAHSAAIRFKEGISKNLMDFIKAEVSQMDELDKICTIGWDEMSLTANLSLDQLKDYIDGFEDLASKRTNEFATHALVFMVRGIKSAYKQPIAYFLTANINSAELAELIKLVIQAVMDTGLKVIGSVCDAVNTNRAAVNKVIDPTCKRLNTNGKLLEYTINGAKIWHYFDPPHLIKSVRNNLLDKNVSHTVSFNEAKFRPDGAIVWNEKNKQQRTATWNDVLDFYQFNSNGMFNLIPKITEEHMNPVRRKMKVNLATQVFSGTYGRNMYLCSKRKEFTNNCVGTSAVLLFFNELFDSVNCDGVPILDKLIGAATTESKHFTFWDYAMRMLESMEFSVNLKTGKPNQSNVFKHFVSTLKGFRQISEYMFGLGFKSIGLRRLSQDGLENQFSKIRSYCGANTKPNARDFRNAYTTSILNTQLSSHSLNANCEADEDKYVLQNLHVLFYPNSNPDFDSNNSGECAGNETADDLGSDDDNDFEVLRTSNNQVGSSETGFAEKEALNCISGKICKLLLKNIKCASCSESVTISTNKKGKRLEHDFMRKQSSFDGITLPKVEFIDCIKTIILQVQTMLPDLCAEKNLMQKLFAGMSFKNNNDELIGCDLHRIEVVNKMKKITAKLTIERFIQQVNRILSGKVTVATECAIQKKALEFKNKKKHIGKFVPPSSSNIA